MVGTIPPSGNVQVSDGDALRMLAIGGVGLDDQITRI